MGSAKNENEETEMRAKKVKPSECMSMPELSRDFYPSSNRFYLKNTISEDGFSMAHPLRAIYNKNLKKFEIFAGNHRLEIAKDLQLPWVPIVIEDIPRHEALAQGFKDNKTHASYNVIDQATHILKLMKHIDPEINLETISKFKGGRGKKSPLHEIAKRLSLGYKTVSNLVALKTLRRDVQHLIGTGKLRYSVALEFLKLRGTDQESLIPRLVEKAIEENWTREETRRRVDGVIRGSIQPFRACDLCGKGFPKDRINWMKLCPRCVDRLRQHYFEKQEPVTPFPSKDRSREVGRRKWRMSTDELLGRIEKARNKEKRGNGCPVSDSETPFMDSVKRLEEVNDVRRKMGLQPLKELKTQVL